jgi:hypothetical protein
MWQKWAIESYNTLHTKYFKCCHFTIMWSKDERTLQLNHLWIETIGVFATCDNILFFYGDGGFTWLW